MSHRFKRMLAITAVIAAFAIPSARGEAVLDLTSGGSGPINGALFASTDQQPTGTGFINSFSRLQASPREEGYNTNNNQVPFDEKSGLWTNVPKVSSLAEVKIGGISYYQFLLDINQKNSDPNNFLSLNRLQIWVATNDQFTNKNATTGDYQFSPTGGSFDSTGNTNGSTGVLGTPGTDTAKVYDIDTGTDNGVKLDYNLNSGSGSGDLIVNVLKSAFDSAMTSLGVTDAYIYLYSAFGNPSTSNDGFEEWAALSGTNTGVSFVPEPSTITLALSGLGALGFAGLRRYRRMGKALA